MTSTDSASLAPSEAFGDAQKESLSAVAILDVETTKILVQPTFAKLEGVPDLPAHQQSSKDHATEWKTKVRPVLFEVNDAILNYNAQFQALYDDLYAFAGQLSDAAKAPEAQANLIAGLTALQETLRGQKARVVGASDAMKALQTAMYKDQAALNGDLTTIHSQYEGDKGKLADLQSLVDTCNSAMSKDLTMIGLGSGAMVVGALTVAVGVAMWLESAGGSTPVIGVGLVVLAGGATAVGIGASDYNKQSDAKSDALRQISTLNAEIAVATSLTSDVTSLVGHLDRATAALGQLVTAWDQLDRDYQGVIDLLAQAQGSAEATKPLAFIVQGNLRASKKRWDDLETDAQTLKDGLMKPLPVDTTNLDNATPGQPSAPIKS